MAAAPTLVPEDLVIVLPAHWLDLRPHRTAPSLISGPIRGGSLDGSVFEWLRERVVYTSNGEML